MIADNIICPLGKSTREVFDNMLQGRTGITRHESLHEFPYSFYGASMEIDLPEFSEKTRLEGLMTASIYKAIRDVADIEKATTQLIVSTTKGNIDLLGKESDEAQRHFLYEMAKKVNDTFGFKLPVIVISNACISGVSAILTAQKWLRMGKCVTAIVCGGDLLTAFTLSGFEAFKAIDDGPCRPYDADRKGINLGEGVGTMVFNRESPKSQIRIMAGAQSNDANHISGPSRTGEGLKLATTQALKKAGWSASEVDYINAHGTATTYNDEMEAVAFDALGFVETPISSLKGYVGHTLGAAGVIESIVVAEQMRRGVLLPTLGYQNHGVSTPINVIKEAVQKEINKAIKTISGFGGCNAAIAIQKV